MLVIWHFISVVKCVMPFSWPMHYMYGIGKPTVAQVVLKHYHLLTWILEQDSFTDDSISRMEQFVCILYGFDNFVKLDHLRAHLLFSCSKPEQLPMTSDAFSFHVARAFHAGKVWFCEVEACPNLPAAGAEGSGWSLTGETLKPIMTSKVPVPKSVAETNSCNCSTGCLTKRCSCLKNNLKCTRVCHPKRSVECFNLPW